MKNIAKAVALVLFTLPLVVNAGTKISTGSMQVSFVVKESCNVQTDAANNAKTPAVACQLNTAYQLSRSTVQHADNSATSDTAAAIRPAAGAQEWTVYF